MKKLGDVVLISDAVFRNFHPPTVRLMGPTLPGATQVQPGLYVAERSYSVFDRTKETLKPIAEEMDAAEAILTEATEDLRRAWYLLGKARTDLLESEGP